MMPEYGASGGAAAPDQTTVMLQTTQTPPAFVERELSFAIPDLDIPAGMPDVEASATFRNWSDAPTAFAEIGGHMHLLGNSIEGRVISEGVDSACALSIPRRGAGHVVQRASADVPRTEPASGDGRSNTAPRVRGVYHVERGRLPGRARVRPARRHHLLALEEPRVFKVIALPSVLVAVLACATPVMAHPEGDFTGFDYLKGTGWGLLGGAGGLFGGALVGTAVGDHDAVAWGAGLGYALGSSWAVYAYGERSGHRGRFLSTAGLGAAGLVAGGLFLFLPDDGALLEWGIPAIFVLPLVGAVAGYALSVDDARPTSSAPVPLSVPLLGGRF